MDSLSLYKRGQLNAVFVGKSTGVDSELIMQMRIGVTAATIEKTCRGTLELLYSALENEYDEKCATQRRFGYDVENREFPKLEETYVAKSAILVRAFIRDYLSERDALLREMASLKSQHTMAIDHQFKVVGHAAGKKAKCSFLVVGDCGIALGYYAVPDDSLSWATLAMKELVARHGAVLDEESKKCIVQGELPKVIYVDKLCEGERTEAMKYFFGMIKKLDSFHLIQHVGKEINGEHPRKGRFLQQLSECIFTVVEEDIKALKHAREQGDIGKLSSKEEKADKTKYVRTVIDDPKIIVSKILAIVKSQVGLDREAKKLSIESGDLCEDITTAHPAYPLVTKKILKCVMNQCIHILNGCVHDEIPMNLEMGQAYYRGTNILLDFFKSLRGSSRVEAIHSVLDRKVYASSNMREMLFDARLHWHLTNYNRERLRSLGRETLPGGVSPSEVNPNRISIVESTTLLFGFGYFHRIMTEFDEQVQDEALQQLDNLLDEEIEIEDILDDNDTADSEEEEEEEVNSDVDYTELLRPMVTKDIPVSVDFSALEQLKGTLNEDMKWTTSNNPFAEATPVEDEEIHQAFNSHSNATFAECVDESDIMAADAGIDIFGHDFGSVTVERFNESKNVSGRRNVQTRTQRGRDAFLELWVHGQNPSSGAALRKWCHSAAVEYEQWHNTQLLAAESEKKATPPLLPVTFEAIRAWVVKMKDISSAPLRDGAFNDKSAQLSREINTFASTTLPLENLPKGAAVDSSTIQVNVAVAARGSSAGDLFDSSTLSTVQKEMPQPQKRNTKSDDHKDADGKPPAKRKKERVPNDDLRRKTAALKMAENGILADPIVNKKRRCAICGKYRNYVFQEMKHVQAKNGLRFCPLADNPTLYTEYLQWCEENKKEQNKQYRWTICIFAEEPQSIESSFPHELFSSTSDTLASAGGAEFCQTSKVHSAQYYFPDRTPS